MSQIWFSRFASSVADHFQIFNFRSATNRLSHKWLLVLAGTLVSVIPVCHAQAQSTLQLTRVASGLSGPVFATSAPGDPNRLFIAEQGGNIRILDLTTNSLLSTSFLTQSQLSAGNGFTSNGERGLLGLAFDPNYQTNRRYYVNYTDSGGNTRVRSFQSLAGNPNQTDGSSAAEILQISQPFSNHNGGWLGFGADNQLYVATGDGGSGNDPNNNALNRNSLLGKMLRITPGTTNAGGYSTPSNNPFVNDGDANTREEIWAYGLRNPWRNSFDRQTGDLYIADVGQGAREEINFQAANSAGGENYGWRVREGKISTGLSNGGLTGLGPAVDPIFDYLHGNSALQGFSVTGGYVYRGPIAALQGHYFFADYVSQRLFSLKYDGTTLSDVTDWTSMTTLNVGSLGSITSFAEDGNGQLYLMNGNGNVYRFSAATIAVPEPGAIGLSGLVGVMLMLRRKVRPLIPVR